jgi:hypothetical protein
LKKKSASSTSSPGSEDSGSDSRGVMILSHSPRTNDPKKGGSGPLLSDKHSFTVDSTPHFVVSGPTSGTGTPSKSTTEGSGHQSSQRTLQRFGLRMSQPTTSSSEDFLARASRLLERGRGLRTLEGRSFTRFAASLGITDLGYFSLRTSKDYSTTMAGGRLEQSFKPLTSWGTMRSGRCLTARTSASRRTGSACSLSDILEENPGEKYFLSEKTAQKIIRFEKERVRSPTLLQATTPKTKVTLSMSKKEGNLLKNKEVIKTRKKDEPIEEYVEEFGETVRHG